MELFDWIDLLAQERRLASVGQDWHIEPSGRIRNTRGQCPLCAWAELQGGAPHTVAWKWALRDLFGNDTPFGDADILADAADEPMRKTRVHDPEVFFARAYLLNLLNLQERTE